MNINPAKMKDEEKVMCKQSVELYNNRLINIVQFGDQFRLLSHYETSPSAMNFVLEDKTKSVLFVYQTANNLSGNMLQI